MIPKLINEIVYFCAIKLNLQSPIIKSNETMNLIINRRIKIHLK